MVKRKNLTSDDLLRRQEEGGSHPKKTKFITLNREQDITSDYSDASSSRSVRSSIQVNGQHDDEDFSDESSESEDENSVLEVSERLNASRLPERIEPIRNTQPRLPASFSKLGVSSSIQNALKTMSIHTPTEVQTACIPPLLDGMLCPSFTCKYSCNQQFLGRDCIGNAKTGSGKTLAFALPIIQKLSVDPYGIYALVLTPTRFVFPSFPSASISR